MIWTHNRTGSRSTGHFQPCFPATRPVSRPVFASKGVSGEGKRSSRVCVAEKFSQDERAPNSPVCVLYYMLNSGGFAAACLQSIAKGGSSILGHPGQTRSMSRA